MPGGSIGTVFVELDLDPSRYTKGQQKLFKAATTDSEKIEENFRKVGIKSSAEMNLMRAKIIRGFNAIANSSKATKNDIVRAEIAKNAKLKQLAEQQYGYQKSLLDRLKARYTGLSSHAKRSFLTTEHSIFNLRRAIVILAGATGIGLISKAFTHAADSAERYQIRLRFLLRSQEEGNKVFQAMEKLAAKVPHELEQILEAATRLGGAVQGSSEEIIKWMPMISDLAAVTGTNIETTISQFIRMYSAGAQAADMFREHGYLAMLGFRTNVHYTAEETKKIMWEAWTKTGSQFKDACKELEKTWTGLMGHMADRWYRFRLKVMSTGIFDVMKTGVRSVIEAIDELEKKGTLDKWAKDTGVIVVSAFKGMVLGVNELAKTVERVRIGLAAIVEMTLPLMIKNMSKQIERLQKQIDKPRGFLSGEPFMIEENKRWLDKLKTQRKEYEMMLKAARDMGKDSVRAIDEINAAFQKVLDTIENIKTGMGDVPKAIKDAGKKAGLTDKAMTGGRLTEFRTGFGLAGFQPFIDFDTAEVEKKVEELIEKLQKNAIDRWGDFSKKASNSFIDAMVDGSDDWLKYLSREFKRTFLQETIGNQMQDFMSKIFGQTGFLRTKTLGGVAYGDILGAGALGYGLGGIGGGLGSIGGFMAGSSFLTEGIFAKGGALAGLGGPIGMLTGGLLGGAIGDLFGGEKEDPYKLLKEMKAQYFNEMKSTFASAISEGFKAGTESEGYKSFIDSMKSSMAEIVKNMFMETFVAQTIKPLMGLFEPVFTQVNALMYSTTADFEEKVNKLVGQLKFMDIYKQIGLKENEIRAYAIEQLKGKYGIPSGIGEIAGAFPERGEIEFFFQQYQPYFEEVSNAMESVTSALGLNTDAIDENTAAILGPVDQYLSTLASMDTGPTSIAAITGRQSELWTKAFASPESFSAYSQFMTGGALDMFSKLSPGYIQGEIQRVQNIGWYQQAKYPAPEYMERAPGPGGSGIRYSPSTQENAAAIKQALGPMFLDLKESQSMPTKITVVFGNKEFDAVLIDSLHNTDVAEEVRYVVSG